MHELPDRPAARAIRSIELLGFKSGHGGAEAGGRFRDRFDMRFALLFASSAPAA